MVFCDARQFLFRVTLRPSRLGNNSRSKKQTYQNSIAVLFALTWGLVLLDRNAITSLFPILMKTFHLNNAQTGHIVSVTGFGFVLSSLLLTSLADRSGLKKIWLVPVIILSGVFSGGTAFAGSLLFMLVVRFLTGFADGPIYPLMTSVLTVQGDPKKFAFYIGISQLSIALIAQILGPTLTIQLALHLDWHYAFIFTSLPAVIVGIIIWFVLKEVTPGSVQATNDKSPKVQSVGEGAMKWKDVPRIFAYRNCTLSFIANVLVMVGFWGIVSFGTTYWASEGGLTLSQAGYLTSIVRIPCHRLGAWNPVYWPIDLGESRRLPSSRPTSPDPCSSCMRLMDYSLKPPTF